jgi:phage terminase large subunit-like protein
VVTRGSTLENAANLAPVFLDNILETYQGTRLGRQELDAEILDDNPGALWKRDQIEALRVHAAPALKRVIVAVDPSATSGGDETGIVVAGIGADDQGYVIDDLSLQGSPHEWASRAVGAYHTQQADRLIGETNNGGEMVELTIRTVDKNVSYKGVHASRGKRTRAEPVAALYEQGKVHHVGMFAELEDQMCEWVPDSGQPSPDRMDALVWALTELMLSASGVATIQDY